MFFQDVSHARPQTLNAFNFLPIITFSVSVLLFYSETINLTSCITITATILVPLN
jgi:hypothetical protein